MIDRRAFLTSASLGTLACWTASAGVFAPGGYKRDDEGPILPWDRVRPGVWVTPADLPGGNVAVIAAAGRAVVIDSKFASVAAALAHDASVFAEPDEAGARLTLVNTHHHGDHTSGNATFAHVGAAVVGHINATSRIASQIDRYRASLTSAADDARGIDPANERLIELAQAQAALASSLRPSDAVPVVAVGPHAEVQVPTMPIELRHFGAGHTDNDLVARIESQNVVHTGDLVFNGLHPFFDASAGVSAAGWMESLSQVEALCDDETVVVPGHGPVGDVEIVRTQRAYIEQLVDAVKRAQADGSTREQATERTFDFMEGLGFDRIRPIAIGVVWDQVAAGML